MYKSAAQTKEHLTAEYTNANKQVELKVKIILIIQQRFICENKNLSFKIKDEYTKHSIKFYVEYK